MTTDELAGAGKVPEGLTLPTMLPQPSGEQLSAVLEPPGENAGTRQPSEEDDGESLARYLETVQRLPIVVPSARSLWMEAETRLSAGTSLLQSGSLDLAIYHYQVAIYLQPMFTDAYMGLGAALARKGQLQWAQRCYGEVLRRSQGNWTAWCGMASVLWALGEKDKAVGCYQEAVKSNPGCFDAHVALGHALKAIGRLDASAESYRQALKLRPTCVRTMGYLGGALYENGDLESAVACYREALNGEQDFPEAYNDLGNALRGLCRYQEAVECYRKCAHINQQQLSAGRGDPMALSQSLAVTYTNLASALKLQGSSDEALRCFECAATLQPASPDAHANLASAYKDAGRPDEAIQSYRRALSLRPNYSSSLANLVHTLQCVCEWSERDANFRLLEADIKKHLARGEPAAVQPFHVMAYPMDPSLVLELTREHSRHVSLAASRMVGSSSPATHAHPPQRHIQAGERLRMGYVSSDFGNHPLSHLMKSVFGLHSRDAVEVFCYALSQSDGSSYRKRIERDADHFVDVSRFSCLQIASRISSDGIQVLIDLNGCVHHGACQTSTLCSAHEGSLTPPLSLACSRECRYTKGARSEIFALRPAPLQVSYMGFPATMGAEFIDYLITDTVVSPPSKKFCYSEALARMPHSYFVNDHRQAHANALEPSNCPTREDVGLPVSAFVFTCSNQLYKFDPETFTVWCNILHRVPNSVLWLLRFPPAGEPRVRMEAAQRGIDNRRIIFTDVADKEHHIKRCRLADLFLDTPTCNAHTTACDVLWSGCPMMTYPLDRMASRVAASLCYALGCPELVVSSHAEYEETAVELATHPYQLDLLRRKVCANRLSEPLFNTHRWVANFERCLLKMWELHADGNQPQDFDVLESS